ncbi:MAG: hypothetical protein JWR10_2307, partial [Rubritepida sp.]|nr:hypothetical protein [Rubritepida sp.]
MQPCRQTLTFPRAFAYLAALRAIPSTTCRARTS